MHYIFDGINRENIVYNNKHNDESNNDTFYVDSEGKLIARSILLPYKE